jgi:DNA-binding CsgD family transcriptional regulator/tetratricopeptide (TPR) repeat protein
VPGFELLGRQRERGTLDRLIQEVRAGSSRVLVLRGEAGSGKTALLEHAAEAASECRVVRVAGVESEADIAYAGLQHLCATLLPYLDRLPEADRAALGTAFGLNSEPPPELVVLGMAALSLFAEAAAETPLICVIDDVQWLDRFSDLILTFVARRLEAESVGLLFGVRDSADEEILAGLPELRVEGLPDADARDLLDSVLSGPVDPRVRDRILAETRGIPLALLELPRGLSPAELAFGFGGYSAAPPTSRVEEGFQRRIAALPPETRTVLVAAAVEPVGDAPLLWRALQLLGVGRDDAVPAEADGLIEIGPRVRFRHPLVRSASWRSADALTLREVHRALFEVIDPVREPDRRAWHRAHAALGPDEEVAGDLENSAGRALARGGRSAAAAFVERAAELTPDPRRRAGRALAAAQARFAAGSPTLVPDLLAAAELGPLDAPQRAEVARLRAQTSFVLNPGRDAVEPLLVAARPLVALNPALARETYLAAVGAAVHAGRLGGAHLLRHTAEAARSAPPGLEVAGLFLTGLSAWILDGYASSVPLLDRALKAVTADDDLELLWIAALVALEIWDADAWYELTALAVRYARDTGALSILSGALSYRAGALTFAGRITEASKDLDEAVAIGRATGLSTYVTTGGIVAAHQGREQPALERIEAAERAADERGVGRAYGVGGFAKAVLYNGLGNYPLALQAARRCVEYRDVSLYGWGLSELVEAATRTGEHAEAGHARERLAELTSAANRPWALGAQAVADALTGPRAEAEEHYREAIDQFGRGPLAVPRARARLLYGEWLRRGNQRAAARTQLRAAHEAFVAMGAEAFADRAGRELVATGETVRRRTLGDREELTPQESQIARLAVSGQTNPEIGAALFLSPRTVEWHLRKVFSKLGITSRRELPDALP